MDDLYETYKKFTDHVTGDKLRRDRIEAALKGEKLGLFPDGFNVGRSEFVRCYPE